MCSLCSLEHSPAAVVKRLKGEWKFWEQVVYNCTPTCSSAPHLIAFPRPLWTCGLCLFSITSPAVSLMVDSCLHLTGQWLERSDAQIHSHGPALSSSKSVWVLRNRSLSEVQKAFLLFKKTTFLLCWCSLEKEQTVGAREVCPWHGLSVPPCL